VEDLTATILCPGQGAQAVGMGKAWYDACPAAKRTFDEADAILGDVLGAPLSRICFDGPADALNRTEVAQPALFVCGVACHRALVERGGEPPTDSAAGLSLGEYTALHLAGVFGFEQCLGLVARRGRLMQEAADRTAGGMVALIGADQEQAEQVCRDAAVNGTMRRSWSAPTSTPPARSCFPVIAGRAAGPWPPRPSWVSGRPRWPWQGPSTHPSCSRPPTGWPRHWRASPPPRRDIRSGRTSRHSHTRPMIRNF